MKNLEGKKSKFVKKILPGNSKNIASLEIALSSNQSSNYFESMQKNLVCKEVPEMHKEYLPDFIVLGTCKKQIFVIINQRLKVIGFVDQHALHERIRYQFYSHKLKNKQNKEFKFIIENIEKEPNKRVNVLGQLQNRLLFLCPFENWMKNLEELKIWGVHIVFKETNVYIQSYCQVFSKKLDDQVLKKIGLQILENQRNKIERVPNSLDFIIGETSCKSAIKFNDQISRNWCYQCLYNAAQCDFPWYCVHGRPTITFRHLNIATLSNDYQL